MTNLIPKPLCKIFYVEEESGENPKALGKYIQ